VEVTRKYGKKIGGDEIFQTIINENVLLTCVLFLVVEEFSGCSHEASKFLAFMLRVHPVFLPRV
jgi:hypothetical protein